MTNSTGRVTTPGTEQLDSVFIERWSTRSFSSEPLSQEEINTLFEAARWTPSANNSQPWHFIYATDGPERELFNSLLRRGNKTWAPSAPLLAFVVVQKANSEGHVFRTSQFDAGAAWMSLAIQAARMGLHTHAMGGILVDEIHEQLGISRDEYDVIAGIAVGRRGDPSQLSEDLQERERPSDRKPLSEVARRWSAS